MPLPASNLINSPKLRKYLIVLVLLGLIIILVLIFVYFINPKKKTASTPKAASSSFVPLSTKTNKDIGISFSYLPLWTVTESKEKDFSLSPTAFSYDFTSTLKDSKGAVIRDWDYKMIVNVFSKATDLTSLAKTYGSSKAKTSKCSSHPNCLIVNNTTGTTPVQIVINGSRNSYILGFIDVKAGKVIAGDKLIGPLPKAFESLKID